MACCETEGLAPVVKAPPGELKVSAETSEVKKKKKKALLKSFFKSPFDLPSKKTKKGCELLVGKSDAMGPLVESTVDAPLGESDAVASVGVSLDESCAVAPPMEPFCDGD